MNLISRWRIWFRRRMWLSPWQSLAISSVWPSTTSRIRTGAEKASRECRSWTMILFRSFSSPLPTIISCSLRIKGVCTEWRPMRFPKPAGPQEERLLSISCSWCRMKRLRPWSRSRSMMTINTCLWQQKTALWKRHRCMNTTMSAKKVWLPLHFGRTITWSKSRSPTMRRRSYL